MKVHLVAIGNSKGIRIPKPLLDQCGFEDAVDMEVTDGAIVLRPVRAVRAGWDVAFQEMASRQDDRLTGWDVPSAWDDEEWEWK